MSFILFGNIKHVIWQSSVSRGDAHYVARRWHLKSYVNSHLAMENIV